MPAHRETSREKEQPSGETRSSVLAGSHALEGETNESDALLRSAQSPAPVQPSLEQWAEFNDAVMQRVRAARRHRPFSRQWRQALFDRISASDSPLKEKKWVALAALVLAFFSALAYLASR